MTSDINPRLENELSTPQEDEAASQGSLSDDTYPVKESLNTIDISDTDSAADASDDTEDNDLAKVHAAIPAFSPKSAIGKPESSWMRRHKKGVAVGAIVVAAGGIGIKVASGNSHHNQPASVVEQANPTATASAASQLPQATGTPSATSIPGATAPTPGSTEQPTATSTHNRFDHVDNPKHPSLFGEVTNPAVSGEAMVYDPSQPTPTKQIVEGLYRNIEAAFNTGDETLLEYSGIHLRNSDLGQGFISNMQAVQAALKSAGEENTFSMHISDDNISIDPTNPNSVTIQYVGAIEAEIKSGDYTFYQQTITLDHISAILPDGTSKNIWHIASTGTPIEITQAAWTKGLS